jgi:hypothetical protein
MYTNIITLLLTLLTLTLANPSPPSLHPRQADNNLCTEYTRIANLSTIGSNSSYRSIFLSQSSVGSMYDAKMFTAAMNALPPMMMDKGLNDRCGNATATAIAEAERNLTKGIVAQFEGVKPGTIKAGWELMVIVGVVIMIFVGTWGFMP